MSLSSTFSKALEFATHRHMSHYFKHKLNPSHYGLTKAKSTTTNLVVISISFLLQVIPNVKLVLFILTLAAHLTLPSVQLYFINLVLVDLLEVTQNGFVDNIIIGNILYAF
jgi:hypothetical protein